MATATAGSRDATSSSSSKGSYCRPRQPPSRAGTIACEGRSSRCLRTYRSADRIESGPDEPWPPISVSDGLLPIRAWSVCAG